MDFDDLATKVEAMAASVQGPALTQVMTDLGVEAKADLSAEAKRAVGPDARMSGWKRGAMNSGFEHEGPGVIVIRPRPQALWTVAEHGRATGKLPRKKSKSIKTVKTPWGYRTFTNRKPMHTGSTRGKRTWTKAWEEVETQTYKRANKALMEALTKAWG